MEKQCTLIYFSPTGTTKAILHKIAEGMGYEIADIKNMTPASNRQKKTVLMTQPVIIGVPVHGGRVPSDAAAYLKTIKTGTVPAVITVVYGNRAYEDALLELKDICEEIGAVPVAGAAFIGEHSFSTADLPIAPGRPDESDFKKAYAFGQQTAGLLENFDPEKVPKLNLPGNFPYKEGMGSSVVPFIEKSEDCVACGTCAEACPKDAIKEEAAFETDDVLCIHCCACIKACPNSARRMKEGPFKEKTQWLHQNYRKRKAPETFFAG